MAFAMMGMGMGMGMMGRLMQPESLPVLQDGEGAAGAAAQCLGDRQVVAAIWAQIELLLCGGQAADAIRQLTAALPVLDLLPTQDLPALAHLHLSSAGHLMATVKMLVPAAFNSSSTEPDVAALAAVTGTGADAVNTLIELQLFHLGRARDLTSQMRARIAQRRELAQQHMQSLVTCSSGSSCDDDSLVQSLE